MRETLALIKKQEIMIITRMSGESSDQILNISELNIENKGNEVEEGTRHVRNDSSMVVTEPS